jgi:hypothetical protein
MARNDVIGDIARVTLAIQYPDSQVQENNISFVATTVGGGDSRAALGAAVYTAWLASFITTVSPTTNFYGYKVSLLNITPPPAPKLLVSLHAGLGSTYNMATQARPVLSWQTALAGRSYRGRIFLPTPTIDFISAPGFPTAAYLALANAFGAAIVPSLVAGGTTWTMSVVHRTVVSVGPPKVISWTSTPVVNVIARDLFGTQRKSGNYGRENPAPW